MTEHVRRGLLADNIQVASSVEEALAHLAAHRGTAQLIAGGTALMPLIQRGECTASHLVDVSRVCAMKRIVVADSYLMIGGAVTLAALADNAVVQSHAPMLYEAAQAMVGPEPRSPATLVGRVVAAEGNAEASVALVALDAEAQITNLTGAQWMPVDALFVRYGVSRVDSTSEIVTTVRVPVLAAGCGTAIGWIERPEPREVAPLVLALVLSLSADREAVQWGSVAMGTVKGIPVHVRAAEEALSGAPVAGPASRERLSRLVGAAGADAMGVDEAERAALRDAIARLAQGCYDQALAAALAGDAADDGDDPT